MRRIILAASSSLAFAASAATFHFSDFSQGGLPIPDGSAAGIADVRVINSDLYTIGNLRVHLDISGPEGWLGDLFVTLQHDTGYSVLLNRPGRTTTAPWGYAGSGLSVWFEDGHPDLHSAGALPNQLRTGVWGPDGRVTDPGSVLTEHARTAQLSSFGGLDPNGEWILFMADLSSGGMMSLRSWSLEFTGQGVSVPEPGSGLLLAMLAVMVLGGLARRQS